MTHTPGKLRADGGNLVTAEDDFDFVIATTIAHTPRDDDGFGNAERLALCWNSHDGLLDIAEKAMEATRRAFRDPETSLGWYADARATLDAIKAARP